jgi:hypothetical protein
MRRILSVCATASALTYTLAMPHELRTNSLNMTALEVGQTIEGLIYGILTE